MNNYQDFFKGKRVTQMGLGLLGRGIGDAAFLAENGADLIVTDMKSAEELAPAIERLKAFPQIKYRLGGHDLADFKDRDLILKASGVPIASPYIAEARKNQISIEMDASLFCKLAPKGLVVIGVTGTKGKSTVTHLIYHILKTAGKSVHLGGNVRDTATLPLINEVKDGDCIVLELDSWQLQGFGESKMSPHISVFTNLMEDHKNYYKDYPNRYFEDKSNIFKFQGKDDYLIVGDRLKYVDAQGKKVIAKAGIVPEDWKIRLLGEHNLENIACAMEACKAIGIGEEDIKKGVESFGGVEGRLQYVKEINGVKIYNDNNATTPEATVAALKALGKNTVLICGGADKSLDVQVLKDEIAHSSKAVILLPGTGSDKLDVSATKAGSLEEAVKKSLEVAKAGDTILFSPAFSSFGLFKNEYDRNDQFLEIVRNLN